MIFGIGDIRAHYITFHGSYLFGVVDISTFHRGTADISPNKNWNTYH